MREESFSFIPLSPFPCLSRVIGPAVTAAPARPLARLIPFLSFASTSRTVNWRLFSLVFHSTFCLLYFWPCAPLLTIPEIALRPLAPHVFLIYISCRLESCDLHFLFFFTSWRALVLDFFFSPFGKYCLNREFASGPTSIVATLKHLTPAPSFYLGIRPPLMDIAI